MQNHIVVTSHKQHVDGGRIKYALASKSGRAPHQEGHHARENEYKLKTYTHTKLLLIVMTERDAEKQNQMSVCVFRDFY